MFYASEWPWKRDEWVNCISVGIQDKTKRYTAFTSLERRLHDVKLGHEWAVSDFASAPSWCVVELVKK